MPCAYTVNDDVFRNNALHMKKCLPQYDIDRDPLEIDKCKHCGEYAEDVKFLGLDESEEEVYCCEFCELEVSDIFKDEKIKECCYG